MEIRENAMKRQLLVVTARILSMFALIGSTYAQTAASSPTTQKEAQMTQRASGPFDVKLNPLPTYNQGDKTLGRMSIDKQFHGDLDGTSKGEMLAAARAGYVAIEKVTGTLKGRTGTFILQHSATMTNGTPHLSIIVVPDSGTGQLTGLAGKMKIMIAADGKHSYEFDYTLLDIQ